MPAQELRPGMDIWIPCEIDAIAGDRSGATIYVDGQEWCGFVSAGDIRRDEDGRAFVRATVIGTGAKGVVVQVRGSSMGSEAIQASPEAFQRHGAVAS